MRSFLLKLVLTFYCLQGDLDVFYVLFNVRCEYFSGYPLKVSGCEAITFCPARYN